MTSGAVYVNITAEEAKQIMDTEEGYIILDVRTQEEYDQGHIPGAIVISHEEIAEKAEEVLTDKDQLILVYCRSGRRSKIAAEALAELACQLWSDHTVEEMQAEFADTIAKPDAAFFLAYSDETVVGFAQCQLRHDYVETA